MPAKCLLSLSSDVPNVNTAIEASINRKVVAKCNRRLVDTGPWQLHVVYNSFRRGIEAYGDDIEKLCIELFYVFKWSSARREDYADIQQKLDLDEVAFLCHVESRWLSLLPAVERVKKHFPALLEYLHKLPDSDKNVTKNDRYKE